MDEDSRRFRHAGSVLWRNVGDEVLVGLPQGENLEILAGTAGRVWHLLVDQPNLTQLSDLLAEQYSASREVIAADVGALLDELRRRGLVEEIAGSGG